MKEKFVQEEPRLPLGARARSKELNRLKILASARTLFRERGYEAATLRDIASEAGLSTGAVFANFSDKNEIFLKIVEEETARILTAMIDSYDTSLSLEDRLIRQMVVAYEAAQKDIQLILSAFVMDWVRTEEQSKEINRVGDLARQVISDTLKHAVELKELPEDANIAVAAEILEDVGFANIRRAFYSGLGATEVATWLDAQVRLIIAGLKAR
ncbi:MAG: TetR/AcrR family transcriptional regulator [Asticcacaulis sp.]